MFRDLATAGSMPALEQMLRFAGGRQRIIAHNIANLNTPNFIPRDVSVSEFQKNLDRAIEARRAETGGERGELQVRSSAEVLQKQNGMVLVPRTAGTGVLFHDRNNRDVERQMQALAENAGAYRVAADLLRSRMDLLRGAIAQRV